MQEHWYECHILKWFYIWSPSLAHSKKLEHRSNWVFLRWLRAQYHHQMPLRQVHVEWTKSYSNLIFRLKGACVFSAVPPFEPRIFLILKQLVLPTSHQKQIKETRCRRLLLGSFLNWSIRQNKKYKIII